MHALRHGIRAGVAVYAQVKIAEKAGECRGYKDGAGFILIQEVTDSRLDLFHLQHL